MLLSMLTFHRRRCRLLLLLVLAVPLSLATTASSASWTAIGPPGGLVSGILVAPSDPKVVYATTPDLYRSDDAGQTWGRVHNGISGLLAVDPLNPLRVFVVRSDGSLAVSPDGGVRLAPRRRGLSGQFVAALAFVAGRPQSMLAATGGGLFRSDDGGASWKGAGLAHALTNVVISPDDPALWLALESFDAGPHQPAGQLWRSDDGGRTWSTQLVGFGPYWVDGPIFDPRDPSRVYLMDESSGLQLSRDRGATFEHVEGSPAAEALRCGADGTLYAVHLFGAGYPGRILVSHDRGTTWSRLPPGGRSGPVDQLTQLIVTASGTLLASGGRGVWRSLDAGRTWQASSWGMNNLRTTSIAVSADGADVYLGVLGEGVYRGDGTSTGWVRARKGLPTAPVLDLTTVHIVKTDPTHPSRAFDLTPSGLYVTDNRADSWRRLRLPVGFEVPAVHLAVVDGTDGDRLLVSGNGAGGNGAALSENGGRTWVKVHDAYLDDFAFDGGDRDRFYAATPRLERSNDHGKTWVSLAAGLPPFGLVERLWTVPGEKGTLFVSLGDNGFYGSRDGGATFEHLSRGKPGEDLHVLDLVVDPESPGDLFLRTVRVDAFQARYEAWTFARTDHHLRLISDASTPNVDSIAARPGALGTLFAAGASAYRIDGAD